MKRNLLIISAFFIASVFYSQNFNWVGAFGGPNADAGQALAYDALGNVYVTGSFRGNVDFDPGTGTFTMTAYGTQDVFVSKFDASGNLIWAKQIGGTGSGTGFAIKSDASNNIIIAGSFSGNAIDFDPGASTYTLSPASGTNDIFICKLTSGGSFVWANLIGNAGADYAYALATDASNNCYLTGSFQNSVDFDPGVGVTTLTSFGNDDIFVLKLDQLGNFGWAKQLGGSGPEVGYGIAVDGSGNVITTGSFDSTPADFDPGAGTYTISSFALSDIFVSKLTGSGNFVWAKRMGGNNNEEGKSVAIDVAGNIYSGGYFATVVNFDPAGTFTLTTGSPTPDGYLHKLDANGNFIWAKQITGSNPDNVWSVTLDASGVYGCGLFSSIGADFDPGPGTFTMSTPGAMAAYALKLDLNGIFIWAKQFSGSGSSQSYAYCIAASSVGLYITGLFSYTCDFDPGPGIVNRTAVGSNDAFILQLSSTTGISENKSNIEIALYPNPSSDHVTLTLEQNDHVEYELYNSLGQIIVKGNFKGSVFEIDLSEYVQGVYFIKLNFLHSGQQIRKIIKN